MARAAVGLRAHSGWAVAVAITGPAEALEVLARRRIEMVESAGAGPRITQPYHAAVRLPIEEAQRIVAACAASAGSLATSALRDMIKDLRRAGHEVAAGGLLLASGRPLPALPNILASHPLLHTAEGELFREGLRAAARNCNLPLAEVKERELLKLAPAALQRHIAALGRTIGPPWRQDEKFAAMAAWLALH